MTVVADQFTCGDKSCAMKMLERDENKIRRKDMYILASLGGCILLLIFLLINDGIREKDLFDLTIGEDD